MKKFQDYFNQEAIVAKDRQLRPFVNKEDTRCPFCSQNKQSLSEVILEKWESGKLYARIVANKFPLTSRERTRGFHDVVIDTIDHLERPKDFSVIHWSVLLETIQQRWQQLAADPAISFIQVFKNDGVDAGASISHSHWQIVALEEIPFMMKKQYERQLMGPDDGCYLCHIKTEGFFVFENEDWRVWVPPEPEFDGEVWLIPKKHRQHYGQLSKEEIDHLGRLIKYLLLTYEMMKPGVAYNICFMSGDLKGNWHYHFYVKMVMRKGRIAGFEIATGCHILNQPPERYAEEIKKKLKGMYK